MRSKRNKLTYRDFNFRILVSLDKNKKERDTQYPGQSEVGQGFFDSNKLVIRIS